MYYKKDWIMDQIEAMTRFMIQVITSKKADTEEITEYDQFNTESNELYKKLHILIIENKLNNAENLLFEHIHNNDKEALPAAILFYSELNSLSDTTLETYDFPRDEIISGIRDLSNIYGIDLNIFPPI